MSLYKLRRKVLSMDMEKKNYYALAIMMTLLSRVYSSLLLMSSPPFKRGEECVMNGILGLKLKFHLFHRIYCPQSENSFDPPSPPLPHNNKKKEEESPSHMWRRICMNDDAAKSQWMLCCSNTDAPSPGTMHSAVMTVIMTVIIITHHSRDTRPDQTIER